MNVRLPIFFTVIVHGSCVFTANIEALDLYKEPSDEITNILGALSLPDTRMSSWNDWKGVCTWRRL